MSIRRDTLRGCLVAVVGIACVVVLRNVYLETPFGQDAPLLMAFGPIALAAALGNWKSGVFATLLSTLVGAYYFIEHTGLNVPQAVDLWRLARLVFTGGLLSWLFEALHAAQRRYRVSYNEVAQKQKNLAEVTENLQLVTNSMAVPVSRCDRELRYCWVSKPYADWMGMPAEQIIGHQIVDVVGREAFEQLEPYFRRALAGEAVKYEQVVNFASLGPRWVNATYAPTFAADGTPSGWVAVLIDVTEAKQVEQALKEGNRRKDEFLAVLSHELRNPLAPIINSLDAWPLLEFDPARTERLRGVMDRHVKQLVRLIDDLMDASRIGRGKLELQKTTVDLATVLNGAVEMSQPIVEQHGHHLTATFPSEPTLIDADAARLMQVFGNVLHNAAKYTQPKGAIQVVADSQGDRAVVKIRDNGVGIPRHMLAEIFESFRQVDSHSSHPHTGLGIGLSLAKQLIEMHGGTIEAHSEGLGKGSEFVITLPALARGTAKPPTPKRVRRTVNIPRHRIVIVDDLPEVAKSFETLFCAIGQDVWMAHDGESAIELVLAQRPDVVFVDIGMPGMDGYDVARSLRSRSELSGLMLVALTGFGQAEDRAKAQAAGFDLHMTKPTSLQSLEDLLLSVPARAV